MFQLILLLAFAATLVLFASQNTTPVQLQFLTWKSQEISLALVIILSAAVGAILALIASIPTHHRRRKELAHKNQEIEEIRRRYS